MSHTERGIYITLLCLCWLETSLPLETDVLAKLVTMPLARFTKIWETSVLRQCFQLEEDGRLHHKRLDAERAKQKGFSQTQSDNSNVRWDKHKHAVAVPSGNAVALPSHSPREEESREKTLVLEKGSGEKPPAPDDLADRARRLLENYAMWYRQYRHGAILRLLNNSLEFDEACKLCALWDDETLEKLAALVLTTDDDYISKKTDRGFKIFAIKASWAHSRLREWEVGQAS